MEKVDNSLITSVGLINSRYYYTLEIPWFNRLSFLALRFPGFCVRSSSLTLRSFHSPRRAGE